MGSVDFYDCQGANLDAIRAGLSVRPGERWSPEVKARLAADLRRLLGQPPSEVESVCCNDRGELLIYVGLGSSPEPGARLNPAPAESLSLPHRIVATYGKLDTEWRRAATSMASALEDHSRGYALSQDPGVRAVQLQIREHALENWPALEAVAARSSDARHRAIAVDAIGYAEHSARQVEILARAVLDPDREVRNNALRALHVLVSSGIELKAIIPRDRLIALLASGTRTDRAKSAAVLAGLTADRNTETLRAICDLALESLIECTRWTWAGHAYWARLILGRLGGMDEATIRDRDWGPAILSVAIERARRCAARF